jgi:TPR repeat protein
MDVDKLLAGQRFDRELDKALSQCDVLIAVISPRWLEILSRHVRNGERDFVHDEIAAALKRDIVVIPVLIGQEGQMPLLPQRNDLPEDIRDLVMYQKHDIAHESFNRDADYLTAVISALLRGGRPLVLRRAVAISSAIGLALIVAMLGYRMSAVRPPPDAVTVIPQLNPDGNRATKAADEAANKKAAEEDAGRQAEEAAKRQADANAAKKKADEEAAKKKVAEEEASRKAAEEARRQADADAAKKKVDEEAAKKKAADEEAVSKAAEEARRQADTNAVKKKAEEDAANTKAAADCDRLAASPLDATMLFGVSGVNLYEIDTQAASTACNSAMLAYPAVGRFAYQAGRVADAKKDYSRATALYALAAARGHVTAKAAEEARRQADTNAVKKAEEDATNTKAAADCDRLAASPLDATRLFGVSGVNLYEIDTEAASTACDSAMLAYPAVGRFAYQAGRVADAKKNYSRATALYAVAAARGHVTAMTKLGSLYDAGSTVNQNFVEARKWYERAVALGDAEAMSRLGNLYEQGHGVTKDIEQARRWYQKAADAGNDGAKAKLKNLK